MHPRSPLASLSLLLLPTLAAAQEAAPPAEPESPAAVTPATAEPAAAPPAVDPGLAARLDEVDQRSRIAERKLELLEEEAAKRKAEAPVLAASERGFNWKSADGGFQVKVRGLVHADAREYLDVENRPTAGPYDNFLVRRARPTLEASFGNFADFRLMPDFGGGTAALQDAYVDLRPVPWLRLRAGKFKVPVGLERLQSASAIVFPERAFPTTLAPNRDYGFQLHGALFGGAATYEVGIFNGTVDNTNQEADHNQAKDYAGRLFLQPWKNDPYSLFANLGVGVAGTTGKQRGRAAVPAAMPGTAGTPAVSILPTSYRTAGQIDFFRYDGAVYARGRRNRLSPQGYWYYGSFGLLAEYILVENRVRKNADPAVKLTHSAWQVAAQWVFGGKPLFEGVTVTEPLSLDKGTWGALELAARYTELALDDETFTDRKYANDRTWARRARAFGGAVNWHWSRNIKLSVAYEHTTFEGGDSTGTGSDVTVTDRRPENVLFQRIQATF